MKIKDMLEQAKTAIEQIENNTILGPVSTQ